MSCKYFKKISARLCYIAILSAFCLLPGCEKEEPPPGYFEECLIGTWCVREFYTSDGITIIHDQEDCVEYHNLLSSKIYTLDNPAFCNLRFIQHIQVWQFQQGSTGLELFVSDLCGSALQYAFSYSNLAYIETMEGFGSSSEGISASVAFIGQEQAIQLKSFILYPDQDTIWLILSGEDGIDFKMRVCHKPA
jgi:hypothetical protein